MEYSNALTVYNMYNRLDDTFVFFLSLFVLLNSYMGILLWSVKHTHAVDMYNEDYSTMYSQIQHLQKKTKKYKLKLNDVKCELDKVNATLEQKSVESLFVHLIHAIEQVVEDLTDPSSELTQSIKQYGIYQYELCRCGMLSLDTFTMGTADTVYDNQRCKLMLLDSFIKHSIHDPHSRKYISELFVQQKRQVVTAFDKYKLIKELSH